MDGFVADAGTKDAAYAMARHALEGLQNLATGGALPAPDPALSRFVAALDAHMWAAAEAGGRRG